MIRRTILWVLVGALAGITSAAVAFFNDPVVEVEPGPALAQIARGFYPQEREGDIEFAWTASRADVSLPGFDRASEWTCSLQFRGARAPGRPQPLVQIAADGRSVGQRTGTNEYEVLDVTIPTRAKSGLVLTIASAPTFVPDPPDTRELGVQVQGLTCHPRARIVMPPRRLLTAAALSAALFGAAIGILGLGLGNAAAATLLFAAIQAVPLSRGFAPYSPYLLFIPRLAFWIALVTVAGAAVVSSVRRQPLSESARLAIAFSAGALLLELMALLHPSKTLIDALFHAHRLEWVLDGRYYFTQPLPSGVKFPYAIALYVVASPFSYFTHDYVSLLRIVVAGARAVAGLLLYPMTMRAWNDRAAAVIAVALFHLVPLPFIVIGNANMTYAFGQSMMVATLAMLTTCSFATRGWRQTIGLFAVASVAFLSHVGIFPLLFALMLVAAAAYRLSGGVERRVAGRIVVAAVLAAVFSVVVYYGHFPESYATLQRVSGQGSGVTAPSVAAPASSSGSESVAPGRSPDVAARSRRERLLRAARLGVSSFGWPTALLALLGTIALVAAPAYAKATAGRQARDRVTLLAAACGIVYVGFVGFSALSPIEPRFERYSEEFISRVNFAVIPITVVLAARGASWTWRLNIGARAVTVVLLAAASILGARAWLFWIQ